MRIITSILFFLIFNSSVFAFQSFKIDTVSVAPTNGVAPEKLPLVEDRPIKNIIFIIGDGTGLAQLFSGQISIAGFDGRLHLQRMPVTGLVNTHAADQYITDSAAGATAYSCGVKTNNGMIGQLPDNRHCKTVLELAEKHGKSTGLISTSSITHATPASFAAHIDSRKKETEIATQYLHSNIEILLGGGLEFFVPQSKDNSSRIDDRNLVHEFQNLGYDFVKSYEELDTSPANKILGLFSNSGLPSGDRSPSLKQMTEKAINVLNTNSEGFFLMIEGSQIDWAGHENNFEYMHRELSDFDEAVASVLDFAVTDGETLVILTADHETGGMNILSGSTQENITIVWTTEHHTGIPVPIMAYGPKAINFTGWWDNTEIGIKIAELSGLGVLPQIIE
jgi:alkaline phosphatase